MHQGQGGVSPSKSNHLTCEVVNPARVLQLCDDNRATLVGLWQEKLLDSSEQAVSTFSVTHQRGWELHLSVGMGHTFTSATRNAIESALRDQGISARLEGDPAAALSQYRVCGIDGPQNGKLLATIQSYEQGRNALLISGSIPPKGDSFKTREKALADDLNAALKISVAFIRGIRASEGIVAEGRLSIAPSQFDQVDTIEPPLPAHDFAGMFPESRRTLEHVLKTAGDPSFKSALGIRGATRLLIEAGTTEFAMFGAKHVAFKLDRPLNSIVLQEPSGIMSALLGESGLESLKIELASKDPRVIYLSGIESFLAGNQEKREERTGNLTRLLRDGMMSYKGVVIVGAVEGLPPPIRNLFPTAISIGAPSPESTAGVLGAEIKERFGSIGKDLDLQLLGRHLRGLSPREIAFLVENACNVINGMRAAGVSQEESPMTTNMLLTLAHDDELLRNALEDPLK